MLEFMSWLVGSSGLQQSPIRSLFSAAGIAALKSPQMRDLMLAYIKTNLDFGNYDAIIQTYPPIGVKRDMAWYAYSFLKTLDKAARDGRLSERFQDRLVNVLLWEVILNWGKRDDVQEYFASKGEAGPPRFLIISPTSECNLRCQICHANADPCHVEKLSYEEFDRILTEAEQQWGVHFFLISGGEPFLWSDGDQQLTDIIEAHPSSFFMVHTNGTTIDDETAARLSNLGTVIPTISIEGFHEQNDERRGEGTYACILENMARLRANGVPFGICLTATHETYETALSDDLLSELFERQGAIYGIILHYFPVGRNLSLDLIPTPEERSWMWHRMRYLVRTKGYVIADYLNSAPVYGGSIVAGRNNGYMHINWNGDVTPCTFLPFTAANIREVYEQGGTLNDAYEAPFLKAVRAWQYAYGFDGTTPPQHPNWLMSCVIRDHFSAFKALVQQHQPLIADEATRNLFEVDDYERWFADYAEQTRALTDPIWGREYLGGRV